MKRIIVIALTVFPILFSCEKIDKGSDEITQDPIVVKVLDVKKSEKHKSLTYSGTIEASKSIPLSFLSLEKVAAIYVDEGDYVRQGQLLAETESERLNSAYEGALAQYDQAIDARTRLKKVYDSGSLPEIKWVEINSKVSQAKANRDMFLKNLENCKLYAPTDGFIANRSIEVGMAASQLVAPFTLVKIDDVRAKISVPENEISYFNSNLKAVVEISAINNRKYIGVVEKVGVVANKLSRTYEVLVGLSNPSLLIKPGMVCEVEVQLPITEKVLLIPFKSVDYDRESTPTVTTVNPKTKRATIKRIQVEGIVDDSVSVSAGLNENEIIVVEGSQKLFNNALVTW